MIASLKKLLPSFDKILHIIIILIIILILRYFIKRIFRRAKGKVENQPQKQRLLNVGEKVLRWTVVILGFSMIASFFPTINTVFKSLLAGSGIAALAISVASQDAISNLVSGIMIVFTKPFQVGDIIRYIDNNMTGIVEEIKIRHTVIRTFENKRLIIPNSIINKTAVENQTFNGDNKVCIFLNISITYDSDITKAMFILRAVIEKHPDFVDRRSPQQKAQNAEPVMVRIIDFAESSIILKAWMWANDIDTGISMKSDVLLELKKRYDAAGIEFAYPHMNVIVSKN